MKKMEKRENRERVLDQMHTAVLGLKISWLKELSGG